MKSRVVAILAVLALSVVACGAEPPAENAVAQLSDIHAETDRAVVYSAPT